MKGIVLAGGTGSRLFPITKAVNKQLLPVYDKPLIYYPLSVLMLAGINEVLIICSPKDLAVFERLFGDGGSIGMRISYVIQEKPRGLADAFILGREFIDGDCCALVLGDNVFHGQALTKVISAAKTRVERDGGAVVFGYPVKDPTAFGVIEFDENGKAVSIEEKPRNPKSNYAVPGLYFYDNQVSDIAATVKPSSRGELEITSVNNIYLSSGQLSVELMGRGMAWLDTGTPTGLLKAAEYVEAVQSRQGYYVACLEEIAYRRGFIDASQLRKLGQNLIKTDYGKYLLSISNEAERG